MVPVPRAKFQAKITSKFRAGKRAALISLSRQRPPPTPPNDPPWKNVFTDISLYDHFELPEHIFGKCHFGNVHEENWCLCPTPYKSTNPGRTPKAQASRKFMATGKPTLLFFHH